MQASALEESETPAEPMQASEPELEPEIAPKPPLKNIAKSEIAHKQASAESRKPKPEPTPAVLPSDAAGKRMAAKPQATPAPITFGRCTTKPGYLMAKDEQVMAKAALLQGQRDTSGLGELQATGLVQSLPARVEIILYGTSLDKRLAKILIPGQEIIFWVNYDALECNL